MTKSDTAVTEQAVITQLEQRLGRVHARQRLGIEADFESRVFGPGISFFHLENWYSVHSLIRNCLRLAGLYRRGRRNTLKIRLLENDIRVPYLPAAFDGYTVLHLSDLHLDISHDIQHAITERVLALDYDLCVLTGDYRARTYGPVAATLAAMERLRAQLKGEVYGVLGNHDSIRMVPALEAMGIRMLLNESVVIERDGAQLHLAGIDDAHFYRVDNMEKAGAAIPDDGFAVLLAHTPEVYRHAAHAGFDVLLCGHTHGGQICLPGGYPVTLDARCPRHLGRGPWRYRGMTGYTSAGAGSSVVPVRLNCPPEITLHRFLRDGD